MQQFVKHFTTLAQLAPLQIEWLAFAEQLATRQGTHLPNWEEFYADREALERRIREQQGS